MGWMPGFPSSTATHSTSSPRPTTPGPTRPRTSLRRCVTGSAALRRRRPERAGELPAHVHRLALEPARVLGQGPRVFPEPHARRHRPASRSRSRARARAPARGPWREDPQRQARPALRRRLPDDVERAVSPTSCCRGHLVREARPVDDRPAPVRAHVQPGDPAALGGAHRLGRLRLHRERFSDWPRRTSACAATSSPRPACTTRPASWRSRTAAFATGARASASRCRASTMPKLIVVERDYPAVAAQQAALGPLLDSWARRPRARPGYPIGRSSGSVRQNGRVRGGSADGRPSLERAEQVARRSSRCRAPRTAG